MAETLTLETTRFGAIAVDRDAVIAFPDGLLGFASAHRFVLVPHGAESPFVWLQSADHADLAFLLMPPRVAFPDYEPGLAVHDRSDVSLWVIITVPPGSPRAMTANLLGPVVIADQARQGWQAVLGDDRYTTRHRVFPDPERPAEAGRQGGERACSY